MDFKSQLLKEHSKKNSLLIRDYIINKPNLLSNFMEIFFGDNYRLSQRSAMVVSALFDYDHKFMSPYIESMVKKLDEEDLNIAVKRNIVRILQDVDVHENLLTSLFDNCIKFVQSPDEAIAVKAFSMKVLVNICKKYPDLKQEVYPVLEEEVIRNEAKGIQARGKAMLKQLSKL